MIDFISKKNLKKNGSLCYNHNMLTLYDKDQLLYDKDKLQEILSAYTPGLIEMMGTENPTIFLGGHRFLYPDRKGCGNNDTTAHGIIKGMSHPVASKPCTFPKCECEADYDLGSGQWFGEFLLGDTKKVLPLWMIIF